VIPSEERLKILNLVREGKITPQEGIRLLEALEKSEPAQPAVPTMTHVPSSPGSPRWLRVRVTDMSTGKVRVNVRLPVTVLNAGVKLGARFSPDLNQDQMGEIFNAIQAGEVGQILDVYDEEDKEHIEVLLE